MLSRFCSVALLAAAFAHGQGVYLPINLNPGLPGTPLVLPPAIIGSGGSVLFGSAFSASGVPGNFYNVCTANTDGSSFRQLTAAPSATSTYNVEAVSLTSDGRWAAYTLNPGTIHEEVHLLNVAAAPSAGSDKTLYSDPQGCVLPLALCFGCTYSCLRTPHISDDGSTALFAQANTPAFLVAKSDGSPAVKLPVYSGTLAASNKRVISATGQVVFTSSALSSAATSAGQVYVMNLDGSNIRKITQFTDISYFPQEATISADGSLIAFTLPSATGTTTLFTIRSDGYNFSAVADGFVSSPSLSADGSLLSYVDSGQVVLLKLGPPQVRTVLTQFVFASDATITDDGTRVAFSSGPEFLIGGISATPVLSAVYVPFPSPTAIFTVSTGTANSQPVYAPRYVYPPYSAVAGSLATSSAVNVTPDFASASSLPLPQTLAGISVTLAGRAAPLVSVKPFQIVYQVPPDTPIGNDALQPAFADGVTAAAATVSVAIVQPSVLGVYHGNTGTAVDQAHPGSAGDVLVMYASGLGPTSPTVTAGTAPPANPPATTVNQPTVTVGSANASVQFSGLAPDLVGVYQINFVLPSGLKPGSQPLSLSLAGQSTGTAGYIYVK